MINQDSRDAAVIARNAVLVENLQHGGSIVAVGKDLNSVEPDLRVIFLHGFEKRSDFSAMGAGVTVVVIDLDSLGCGVRGLQPAEQQQAKRDNIP